MKKLLLGDEAIAQGAIDAGLNTGMKEVKFNRHQVLMTLGYTF